MFTLLDINGAVNDTISMALAGSEFSDVSIVAEDIEKPITRPSIKVEMDNSTNSKFNDSCREKNATYNIYFFCTDRNNWKIDNAKIQDLLENAFLGGLYVNGAYIPIDVESEITDTVLVCSFDVYLVELLPDTDTSEPMETLEFQ